MCLCAKQDKQEYRVHTHTHTHTRRHTRVPCAQFGKSGRPGRACLSQRKSKRDSGWKRRRIDEAQVARRGNRQANRQIDQSARGGSSSSDADCDSNSCCAFAFRAVCVLLLYVCVSVIMYLWLGKFCVRMCVCCVPVCRSPHLSSR